MTRRLVLIHTLPPLIGTFTKLVAQVLPEAKIYHVLDEPLLERVRRHKRMDDNDIAALQAHVNTAQDIGAEAVLVTCSTLSPGLDRVRAKIPVIKIDAAMIAQAVERGTHIGVLATAQSTLEPTRSLLNAEAERQGKRIETTLVLVEGALDALLRGDGTTHDSMLRKAIQELALRVDVIVLAQASMARVLESIPEQVRTTPILTSPHTALTRVSEVLENRGGT